MTPVAYHLEHLVVRRGSSTVLELPSLEIPVGGVRVVMGANGAGKSTLLRVLAFLQPTHSGSVRFAGRKVRYREDDLMRLRRQVTYVSQSPVLFDRSVAANVAYGLRVRRLTIAGRVEEALAEVGLAGFADRPARKLSGGETQRVAIARALVVDPDVYLFDEPTASIDREWVPLIESLLQRLGLEGKTVVVTTHDATQAHRLSASVIVLDGGRLAPSPILNVLSGVTTHNDTGWYFESQQLRIELPGQSAPQTITVAADDIIVSRSPLESSARNCFSGRIVAVDRLERGIVLSVDCGVPIKARITRHSFDEMQLEMGSAVFVTFKASAISGA